VNHRGRLARAARFSFCLGADPRQDCRHGKRGLSRKRLRQKTRLQLLTIVGLLSRRQMAEHNERAPGLNFKKARSKSNAAQWKLI